MQKQETVTNWLLFCKVHLEYKRYGGSAVLGSHRIQERIQSVFGVYEQDFSTDVTVHSGHLCRDAKRVRELRFSGAKLAENFRYSHGFYAATEKFANKSIGCN